MKLGEDMETIERYFFLLLFAPDSSGSYSQPIRGNTWLQKEMFILSKLDSQLAEDADFDAYSMGAYSDTVAEIQDQFVISGYIDVEKGGTELTKLTLEGRKEAERVWGNAGEQERKVVSLVKSWLNDLTFNELLAVVYAEYPESASKSSVKGQVDARAHELAVSLLRKNKVSSDLAQRISGLNADQFEKMLKSRGLTGRELESEHIVMDAGLMEDLRRSYEDSRHRRLVAWEKMSLSP